MPIGCNTLYPHGPLIQGDAFSVEALCAALGKLAEMGYEAVEYSHCHHLTLGQAEQVGMRARELGLLSWCCHAAGPVGFLLGESNHQAVDSLLHCLEICAALGGRVVVVHVPVALGLTLGDAPDLDALRAADLAVLGSAQVRAEELGLELALENGQTLSHWQYVLNLIPRLPGDNVGLCVDSGHANLGDLTAPRAVALAGSRLFTTHLHDNWGLVDDHLPPGEATIDWSATFAALRDIGYDRPLMLELTDRAKHRHYDQDEELRRGLAATRRLAGAL